ncbi:hypothetical protein HG537_0G00600 [Torulaspora globosa]|uniref:Uncharacterized protein n=1 Tax=Torulaspora globosa TaxID=48254 RepID=A0A7H9HYY2_9SACH|nr:hypothetical protein HG537_0G00600 [Torulaspora sp. CBS 2947]
MAKTLAQGRKPGSGRKPGKGKTLREGRKPGSGRRRRIEDPNGSIRSTSREAMTSRDLEAVDALRELNNSPAQQLPQRTPQCPLQSSSEGSDPDPGHAVSQNRLLSNATGSVPDSFTFQSVGPYMASPQYMHTGTGVSSPLLVQLASGSLPAESPSESTNNRSSNGDDANTVLVHTST